MLKSIRTLGSLVLVAIVASLPETRSESPAPQHRTMPLIQARTGITVETWQSGTADSSPPPKTLGGEKVTELELDWSLRILASELFIYPPKFLEKAGISKVVLCHNLTRNGKRIGGVALPNSGAIALDVQCLGTFDEPQFRRSIQHEIFHMIALRGQPDAEFDRWWVSLNPEGSDYGGERVREALEVTGVSAFEEKPESPGFLDYYAMVSLDEDQAEVFSWLVTRPVDLEELAGSDPALGNKVAAMKRRIHGFFPAIDDAFLERCRHTAEVEYHRLVDPPAP